MSILAQFTMYPYIVEQGGFSVPGRRKAQLFEESSQKRIIDSYRRNKENSLSRSQVEKIQEALNGMVENQSKNYEELVNKLIEELDTGLFKELQELDGVVKRKGASFSLSAVQEYDNEIRMLADKYLKKKVKSEENLSTIIQQLNGQLNILRGDIFENLLAYVFDDSINIINNKVEQKTNELLENFKNKFTKDSLNNFNMTYKTTKVQGNELKDSILIKVGDKGYTVSGSKGKTDVIIQTTLEGNIQKIVGISAKSYTSSRSISLLSNANLASLIAQWPIKEEQKNLALNAFTSKAQIVRQYDLSKTIFLLQALIGTENDNILSELIIINRNTKEKPFIVFNTCDLILGNFNGNSLEGKFSPISPLDFPRTKDSFLNFIKSTTISVSTKQKISKLAKWQLNKN